MSELRQQNGAFSSIGPEGLTVEHFPGGPTNISIADALEGIRWVHDDLKQIHQAFGALHQMREQVARMAAAYQDQAMAHQALRDELAETVKVLAANYTALADHVAASLEAQVAEAARMEQDLNLRISQQFDDLRALIEYRWYRALWGRFQRYVKGDQI